MDKIIYEKVGQRLKQARELRHITLEEAGKKVDVHKSTVLRWENGETEKFKIPTLEILANYYNVNPAWLMGYDVPMERNINKETTFTSKLINIPVLGRVPAGQPLLADENIEGYLPIDPAMYGIDKPDGFFFLRVQGESMNKLVSNGSYVLIRKQDYCEENDVIVAIVNGDGEVTLKRFKDLGNGFIALKPESTYNEFSDRIINTKDTTFKIIGKVIGDFKKW